MVLEDLATSVARSGFTKLCCSAATGQRRDARRLLPRPAHGDRLARLQDLPGRHRPGPGLVAPEEAAIAMHSGDSETSMVRHLTPELVHMDRAEGYIFDSTPDIGYSFKGHDVIEAWVPPTVEDRRDRQPAPLVRREGGRCARRRRARLAQLLEAIYRSPKNGRSTSRRRIRRNRTSPGARRESTGDRALGSQQSSERSATATTAATFSWPSSA